MTIKKVQAINQEVRQPHKYRVLGKKGTKNKEEFKTALRLALEVIENQRKKGK